MIQVAVYNRQGKEVESLKVDESSFGKYVRYPLLKQAIVMYHANKRVGTAATKDRSMIEGSTRKLYKQKGTGRARAGSVRSAKRIGGGVAFEKYARDFRKAMPKKQRKLATDSAILSKLISNSVIIVEELNFSKPKTKEFAQILDNLNIGYSCLVTLSSIEQNLLKSVRNIPKIAIMSLDELNAGDICSYKKVLFTKEAFVSLLNKNNSQEN